MTTRRWSQRQIVSAEHLQRLLEDRPYDLTINPFDEMAESAFADAMNPTIPEIQAVFGGFQEDDDE